MVHLNYRDSRPIYSQIVDDFKAQIQSGILADGEKLPSVRELAMQLTINPNTIQRAYRQLEAEGWIATVPGKGCFVCGVASRAEERKEALLKKLEEVAAELLSLGCTRQELLQHLTQGGEHHA